MASFKPGDNLDKWMESIWTTGLLHQGGAALQHWVHEVKYLENGLQPPPSVLHTAVRRFTSRDANTATLEAMVERGEIQGALQGFALSRPRVLGIGDEVELLVQMPTEIEGETKDEWINRRATIVKVEGNRFLVLCKGGQGVSDQVAYFESARVCQAPTWRAFGYSTPRHGGWW